MNDRLTIGEFSRFCQVTVKTLRHYERMKLLVPSEVDEWTHYRYYNVSQLQQLNGILRLKEMGFSLEEVRELQDEGTNQPSMKQLEGKITQTENLLDALHERLALLKRMADMRSKIEAMDKISIQHLPEMVVASHRHMLRRREEFLAVCACVMGPEVQRMGCRRSLPLNWFVVEHDKEVKKEDIDIEIFEEVEDLMPDSSILKFRVLPEVPVAVCMKCQGTFEHLARTLQRAASLHEGARIRTQRTTPHSPCGIPLEPERPREVALHHPSARHEGQASPTDEETAVQKLKNLDIEMHAECLFACHPEQRSPYL